MSEVAANVLVGPERLEMQSFEVPRIGETEALLRLERCGICGTDVEYFMGGEILAKIGLKFPFIPGHEPLGVIEAIGDEARRRWGVQPGDRVAVETPLRCGACRQCLVGDYLRCSGPRPGGGYGHVPTSVAPSLWGGYAEMMFLDANTIVHKVPDHVSADVAVLFNPLAAGVRWASHVPGTKRGDTVVVFGPGQRGLACVIAAREAGAELVIVTGTAADRGRLDLARTMGADITIDISRQDAVEVVTEATSGAMADIAIDVSALATQPIIDAIHAVKVGGKVIIVGMKAEKPIPNFVSDDLIHKQLTVIGVKMVDYPAYARAVEIIASGRYPLEKLRTHSFPIDQADHAIRILAREVSDGVDPVTVALTPGTTGTG